MYKCSGLVSSQVLKAQTHPAVVAKVDALLLTLSRQILCNPSTAGIVPSLLLAHLFPTGDPEHSGGGAAQGSGTLDEEAPELGVACTT